MSDKHQEFSVLVIYNGIEKEIETDLKASVKSLLDKAIHAFAITNNPHILSLYNAAGAELNESQSVHDAGIKKHDRLLLRPSQVKGGTRR